MRRFAAWTLLDACFAGCATASSVKPPRTVDPSAVTGTVWQWVGIVTPVERFSVPAPERYTIQLADGSKVRARFDCNRGGGTYQLSPGKLMFGPMLSTRMACPPDSMDARFMGYLGQVASFFVEDGVLYLELKLDSGTMKFRPEP